MVKRTKKQKRNRIVIISSVIIVALLLVGFFGFVQNTAFGNLFAKPLWGRYECEPTATYEGKFIKWLDQEDTFRCDDFTDECRLNIVQDPATGLGVSGKYKICNLGGSNCGFLQSYQALGSTPTTPIPVPIGKEVQFETGLLIANEDRTKITLEWRPWRVFRHVGGAKFLVNSANCDLTSSEKALIRTQDDPGFELKMDGGEGRKWVNYVDDWAFGPGTNVFPHPTYGQVYCTGGKIYNIVELRMSDNNLIQIDPTYRGFTESGDSISGLGNVLENVACCPNEAICQSDFTIREDPTTPDPDKECFSDLQCFGGGGQFCDLVGGVATSNTIQCISNKCVEVDLGSVECCTNAQCETGDICDLSTLNYGKCITQTTAEYCGDAICQVNENYGICSADCEQPPVSCNPLFQDLEEGECKLNTNAWIAIVIGGIIILLILIGLFRPRPSGGGGPPVVIAS